MSQLRNYLPATGNLNTLVAGSQVNGTSFLVSDSTKPKVKQIWANISVTAATATITIAGKWQVSLDGTNWIDVANGSQNAASVVLATGTSAAVTKAVPAPEGVTAWGFCRYSLVTGVATGAAGDLYSIAYVARTTQSLDG